MKLLDSSKNVLAQASLPIAIGNVGIMKITNNFTNYSSTYNGTYTLTQLPVKAGTPCYVTSIPSWGNGYAVNLAYSGLPNSGGEVIWLNTTGGIGGNITNYSNGVLSEWGYGVPGSYGESSLLGSGNFNIVNLTDKGGITTITFSFSYTGANGTSSGPGTFIYPDSAVTTYPSGVANPKVRVAAK